MGAFNNRMKLIGMFEVSHQRLETANYVFDFENLNKYITDEKK